MLGINRKDIWHDRDSNPKPTAWERCCPNPTAAIYFWIKRVESFALKKKKFDPTVHCTEWIFFCIFHIRRKIITKENVNRGWYVNVWTAFVGVRKSEGYHLLPILHQLPFGKSVTPIVRNVLMINPILFMIPLQSAHRIRILKIRSYNSWNAVKKVWMFSLKSAGLISFIKVWKDQSFASSSYLHPSSWGQGTKYFNLVQKERNMSPPVFGCKSQLHKQWEMKKRTRYKTKNCFNVDWFQKIHQNLVDYAKLS